MILPDVISKEPLGPAVRQGDEQWVNIVKWTIFALVNSEELGVSSTSIEQAVNSKKPEIMRLVGTEGNFGERTGLSRDWVVRIVRRVGNSTEMFQPPSAVGPKLRIPPRLTQLWTNHGLLHAPPIPHPPPFPTHS